MNILTLEDISLAFGQRKILDQTSFYLEEGEKVGVVGINGTGKSTLLKIIAGIEEVDEGRVVQANQKMVRFLPQSPEFPPEITVLEAVLQANDNLTKDHTEAERRSKSADIKNMLTRLGVTDFEQPCGQLSGGQKKRLALVSVLLSPAEILVLDEPTNHLDHEMSDWLEEQLRRYRGAIVMVTHDRYFLDRVSNRIIEVDKGKIYSYDANYAGYLELKMQRMEMERAGARKRAGILRNELAWVQRGAQARSTKQKARLERFEELKNTKEVVEDGKVELSSVSSRLGKTTIELEGISKSFGEQCLIRNFTYIFQKDDRVGFVGTNGCGKSTLMKLIVGKEAPDSGKITIGQTVKIGYYAQTTDADVMDDRQRVIDYLREEAEYVETAEGKVTAARMLEKFLFVGEDQYGLLGKLSGGERRRLHLCRVLMGAPNVLILDEPTNDLDITTLQILEDYLDTFPGIVIMVSHDRYFLDRVARRIFAFEGNGKLRQYEGGYSDYIMKRDREKVPDVVSSGKEETKTTESGNRKEWKGAPKKLKFSYQEQREYDSIEGEISQLEDKIKMLESECIKYSRDFVKLNEITQEKEKAELLLEQKMNRWMELEELAERIKNGES